MNKRQEKKRITFIEILILLTVLTVFLSAIYRIYYAIATFKILTEIKPLGIALCVLLIGLKILEIKKK